ncbi:hypothetical protein HMPREF9442_01845 [Paraprevotella xylaniphila YIT 11841]|uniref:Uncharacterized protein n=1 Tax=Paraprevotella xylaniphila YIT 11841 TaxID=762982 RepID=F3QUH4_9BACT|nr:hypothetical protein HMPREF9442_01845 [Paraprevotella xylaniphila YIT 11841]
MAQNVRAVLYAIGSTSVNANFFSSCFFIIYILCQKIAMN